MIYSKGNNSYYTQVKLLLPGSLLHFTNNTINYASIQLYTQITCNLARHTCDGAPRSGVSPHSTRDMLHHQITRLFTAVRASISRGVRASSESLQWTMCTWQEYLVVQWVGSATELQTLVSKLLILARERTGFIGSPPNQFNQVATEVGSAATWVTQAATEVGSAATWVTQATTWATQAATWLTQLACPCMPFRHLEDKRTGSPATPATPVRRSHNHTTPNQSLYNFHSINI